MIDAEMIKFKEDPDHDPNSLYDCIQLGDLRQGLKQKDEEIASVNIYILYMFHCVQLGDLRQRLKKKDEEIASVYIYCISFIVYSWET